MRCRALTSQSKALCKPHRDAGRAGEAARRYSNTANGRFCCDEHFPERQITTCCRGRVEVKQKKKQKTLQVLEQKYRKYKKK